MSSATPDIKGIILDFDHTLYEHGEKRFDLYTLATAQAALKLGLKKTFEQAAAIARESNALTHNEFTHFIQQHGLLERQLLHEYDKIAARIFPGNVRPVEGLTNKFNRLSPARQRAILTHSSMDWLQPMLRHLGLGAAFKPDMIFTQDHPGIQYRKKSESREVFELVAQEMGLAPENIAVVDDTPANLVIPALLGMYTVLVTWGKKPANGLPYVSEMVDNVTDFLRPELFPELAP